MARLETQDKAQMKIIRNKNEKLQERVDEMTNEIQSHQAQIDKEKTIQISDLYREHSESTSLKDILEKIDGGKMTKRKSKLVVNNDK